MVEHRVLQIFHGIPLVQVDVASSVSQNTNGVMAFFLGVVLSVLGWIVNQAWTILSLVLFGPFNWSHDIAWKHLLFCIFGSSVTTIAWYSIFKRIFPDETLEDDADKSEVQKKSYRLDVSDALQDLGEIGFVVGFFSSQYAASKFLKRAGILPLEDSNGIDRTMMIVLLVWLVLSKMKDFLKAMKRAKHMDEFYMLQELNHTPLNDNIA